MLAFLLRAFTANETQEAFLEAPLWRPCALWYLLVTDQSIPVCLIHPTSVFLELPSPMALSLSNFKFMSAMFSYHCPIHIFMS